MRSTLYSILAELIRRSSENLWVGNPGKSEPKPIELDVLEYIETFLNEHGIKTKRVGHSERPNLLAEMGGEKKTIVFNGHMDTVPVGTLEKWKYDPFSATIEGDLVYGRGAADMKGGLAVYLALARKLVEKENDLPVKVQFQFVVDEETGAASPYGAALLVEKGYVGDFVIIAEPGMHKIANGHKGLYRFKITVEGEAVHTGLREWEQKKKGKNAILEMVKVIERAQGLAGTLEGKTNPLFSGRKNVITFPIIIHGGTGINMVPDKCEAFGDCRLVSLRPEEMRKFLKECMKDVKGSIEDLIRVPPAVVPPDDSYVLLLHKIVKEVLGEDLKIEPAGPACDLWHFIERGVSGVSFGPEGGNVHAPNEWVSLSSMEKLLTIYEMFLFSL